LNDASEPSHKNTWENTSLHLPSIPVNRSKQFYETTKTRSITRWRLDGDEGVDFVRCQICGDHRRVISGRHLSKHDIDRETYMEEYDLSPDELIAKAFRIIQSSHPGYYPHTKKGWIVATQKVYENDGKVFAKYLQQHYPQLYSQGVWIFGNWDKALRAAGFDPDKMRMSQFWDRQKIIKKLQNMRDRKLPLYARYMLKNDATLFSSSRTEFGSWNSALHAAGITKQVPKKLHKSRLGTLRSLRDVIETRSELPIDPIISSPSQPA
jgi:hypothetical protein